jgi:DNA-binding MarR family transcriptional regulator
MTLTQVKARRHRQAGTRAAPMKAMPALLVEQPGHLTRRLYQIAASIFSEEFADADVTPIQYAILCAVHDHPGIDQVTIAGLAALDTSTAASVCTRLEERALVRRAQAGDDRRKKSLALTERGEEIVRSSGARVARLRDRVLAPLAPREREQFLRLLKRLVEANNDLSRAPYLPRDGDSAA